MTSSEPSSGYAIAAVRTDGQWRCVPMKADVGELDSVVSELRVLGASGAALGMLAVDDDFFVLVRLHPDGIGLLISDAAAADDYDLAAEVLDRVGAEPPDEDDEDVWPAGELGMLADIGLPEGEVQVIVEEVDLYPDEQLQIVAQRCGFGDEFEAALDRIGI